MEVATYRVPGMTCSHCVRAVEGEVGGVEGVAAVEVDLETKLVRVSGERLDDAALRRAIEDAGYDAE